MITREYLEAKVLEYQKAADELKRNAIAHQAAADAVKLILNDWDSEEI